MSTGANPHTGHRLDVQQGHPGGNGFVVRTSGPAAGQVIIALEPGQVPDVGATIEFLCADRPWPATILEPDDRGSMISPTRITITTVEIPILPPYTEPPVAAPAGHLWYRIAFTADPLTV